MSNVFETLPLNSDFLQIFFQRVQEDFSSTQNQLSTPMNNGLLVAIGPFVCALVALFRYTRELFNGSVFWKVFKYIIFWILLADET